MFVNNFLGTASKIKILRTLTETNNAYSIKEMENETGLSRGIIHRELKRLLKETIIFEIKSVGKERAYRINMENPYSQKISDIFSIERGKDRKNKVVLKIWNILESLVAFIMAEKLDIVSVMLFGSHARGMASPRSDIDLLIITKNDYASIKKKLATVFEKYENKLKVKVNPVYMPLERYNDEQKTKSHFINEINKSSIEIYGDLTK